MKGKGKLIFLSLLVILVIVLVVVGIWCYYTFNSSRSDVADNQTRLEDYVSHDQQAIKRGEYVARTSDCAACHTEKYSGGYKFDTPFGQLFSSNITPDADTGIGNMTERDFFNAVRQGMGSHGPLYPGMPYTAYVKLSDRDMHDLWAYMSTVKPVHKDIDENGQLAFPFNIRMAMLGWDLLFFDNQPFKPSADHDIAWNRGKYLVDGPGHCSACHSPRNFMMAEKNSQYLQGGSLAPDITPNTHTGIGHWNDDQLIKYLKTGTNGIAVATGGMAEAVEFSTQYFSDDDLKAVATYLDSLKPSPHKAPDPLKMTAKAQQQGALSYEVDCAACHGVNGEGMGGLAPAFAHNPAILQPNAETLIQAVLKGARAPHTQQVQTAAGMPSFAWKLSDQQIANVLNFVRNNWGNSAPEISASDVAKKRADSNARAPLQNPHTE